MSEAVAHPRETFALDDHEAEEAAFEDARLRGRLHHAWLLVGPEGVGKATFAYRAARRLLGAPPLEGQGALASSPDHPASRQMLARSHPDLLVLERVGEDGKPRKVIPVDEARRLGEFFSKSPASAPHRVAIVDAADDLNPNAANALLKTLEEPPPKGVLFLVSHSPGRLLPTIRSRCRRLVFRPPGVEATAAWIQRRFDLDEESALRLSAMAGGAPGRALTLAAAGALDIDDAARALLQSLPQVDEAAALAIVDRFRGGEGAQAFSLLFDRLADQVHRTSLWKLSEGRGALDRWAQAWEMLQRLPREVEALNLDRADAFFTALAELRAAARAS
jgi:DNA polymerase-3 subunit delta'